MSVMETVVVKTVSMEEATKPSMEAAAEVSPGHKKLEKAEVGSRVIPAKNQAATAPMIPVIRGGTQSRLEIVVLIALKMVRTFRSGRLFSRAGATFRRAGATFCSRNKREKLGERIDGVVRLRFEGHTGGENHCCINSGRVSGDGVYRAIAYSQAGSRIRAGLLQEHRKHLRIGLARVSVGRADHGVNGDSEALQ